MPSESFITLVIRKAREAKDRALQLGMIDYSEAMGELLEAAERIDALDRQVASGQPTTPWGF